MHNIEEYIPVRLCGFEINDNVATVFYDKFEKTWLDKLIGNKKTKTAKVDFDQIGSFVWLNCDGKTNVKTIIEKTKEKFSDADSIDERVILFLKQLENRKFIRFYERKMV